mgnify:CR=1 FL=1
MADSKVNSVILFQNDDNCSNAGWQLLVDIAGVLSIK